MARLTLMSLVVAACFLALPAGAQAAKVNDYIFFDGNTLNEGDDANVEYLVKGTNNSKAGVLEVGDIIRGAVTVSEVNSQLINANGIGWTAVFSIRIRDIVNTADKLDASGNPGSDGVIDSGDIIFEPDPGFQAFLSTLDPPGAATSPDGPSLGAVNTHVMVRMFETSTPTDINPLAGATTTAGIQTYAGGAFYWDLGYKDPDAASHADGSAASGITSGNGEGWVARADQNGDGVIDIPGNLIFGALAAVPPTDLIGVGDFSLSRINGGAAGSYILIDQLLDALKQYRLGAASGATGKIVGFSSVEPASAAQKSRGFDAKSSSQLTFIAAVPLPGAVWPGLFMLLGVGAVRIRGRRKAA